MSFRLALDTLTVQGRMTSGTALGTLVAAVRDGHAWAVRTGGARYRVAFDGTYTVEEMAP